MKKIFIGSSVFALCAFNSNFVFCQDAQIDALQNEILKIKSEMAKENPRHILQKEKV